MVKTNKITTPQTAVNAMTCLAHN